MESSYSSTKKTLSKRIPTSDFKLIMGSRLAFERVSALNVYVNYRLTFLNRLDILEIVLDSVKSKLTFTTFKCYN